MLISASYKELNKRLHSKGNYGFSGHKYAPLVANIARQLETRDILDYGCGARTLEHALGYPIRNYDPCIEGLDTPPEPADIVVCSDVLEHIEPDCLDDVLDDLKRVTRKLGVLVIATRPAIKFLEDGRNAHLIQEGIGWWLEKLGKRFAGMEGTFGPGAFTVVVRPLG